MIEKISASGNANTKVTFDVLAVIIRKINEIIEVVNSIK